MTARDPDALLKTFTLEGARVAVLGYDADAREHALALRRTGNHVVVGVLPETSEWWRAAADGFAVEMPGPAAAAAEVVVVRAHEDTATWRQGEERIAAGALVVFACAVGLHSGRCARSGMDVVLVTTVEDARVGCRLAVHRDITRRALARAIAYARASHGSEVPLRTTSVADEAELERSSPADRSARLLALAVHGPAEPPVEPPPAPRDADDDDDAAPAELDDAAWFYAMMNRRGTP